MLKFFGFRKEISQLVQNRKFIRKYSVKMSENEDNRLETFRRICDEIATERSYNNKSRILQEFLRKGSDKKAFKGDTLLWIQMLLPSTSQRVYNLQNKQMLKLFSRIFACNQNEMQLDLEQEGDVSETLRKFFDSSEKLKPQGKSKMYLQEVEKFLLNLEQKTKEDEQTEALRQLCKQTTAEDLKMIIRIIKQDLRINAGARHILDAFGPSAYPAYQSSRDLAAVVQQFAGKSGAKVKATTSPKVKAKTKGSVGNVQVMTPISPMLANACKSVDEAFKKCPSGMYSEIKYDGERVQIHKQGNDFKFFSRNLKPVMDHKVKRFKEFIPKAFPVGGDMILDSEIILVDTVTGDLLPFGTLGAHKKKEYEKAEVCLFVFDCILYDGEDLTDLTFRERRKILEDNIQPIKSYVQLSESHFLKTKNEVALMTAKVLKANLEGVVLKNPTGKYQPGKRGWLKVKKDYLFDGKMADTADLVVLGGSFGSGKKGGILSIFLMGCFDRRDGLWKTVTKVHSGLDDATNEQQHEKLMKRMVRTDPNKLPSWFLCKKSLIPDFIAKSPSEMPVWEITGAEFTKSEAHTAAGISIRFPRITRLREDKSAKEANDLEHLQNLYEASKNNINVDLLIKGCDDDDDNVDDLEIDSKCKTSPMKTLSPATTTKTGKERSRKMKAGDDSFDEECPKKKVKQEVVETEQTPVKKEVVKKEQTPVKKEVVKKEQTPIKKEQTPVKEVKKGQKEKQLKLNFAKVKVEKTEKESDIFKDVVAYFDEKIESDRDSIERMFISHGGTVTRDSKKATVALYARTDSKVKLDKCRQKFAKSCRHLEVKWVRDSVTERKCMDFPLYAVLLK